MSAIADTLNAVADLLEPEGRWTRGCYARTEKGNQIGPLEANAKCWCVSGAIQKIEIEGGKRWSAWNVFDAYTRKRGFRHMADFNDQKSQAEVVRALRDAAAKATEESA